VTAAEPHQRQDVAQGICNGFVAARLGVVAGGAGWIGVLAGERCEPRTDLR